MVWIFRLAHCQWCWWLWWWLWWFWWFCWCWWQIVVWMVCSSFFIQLPQLPTSRHSPCIRWSSHSQSLERQPLPKVCQDVSLQTTNNSLLHRCLHHDVEGHVPRFSPGSQEILVTFEIIKLNTCHFWIIQVKKGNEKKYKKMIRWKSLKHLSSHTWGNNLG